MTSATALRHEPPTLSELTSDELSALAVESGAFTAAQVAELRADLHNEALFCSKVRSTCSGDLHRRMMRGEFTLCSRRQAGACPVHLGGEEE